MTRAGAVPTRLAWAVDQLDLRADSQVLEVGCGPGVAAALLAERVPEGLVVAIDRSATAIERARRRVPPAVVLERVDLASFRSDVRFDRVLAVHVNVFWTTPAEAECARLREALAPGGEVHLVWEALGDRSQLASRVASTLEAQGFATQVRCGPGASLVAVVGSTKLRP